MMRVKRVFLSYKSGSIHIYTSLTCCRFRMT